MSLTLLVAILSRDRIAILGAVPLLVAGIAWEVSSALGFIPIPRLSEVLQTLAACLMNPEFLSAFATTFFHLLIGVAIATSVAVPLGILTGSSEVLDAMLMPLALMVGMFPDPLLWIWLLLWLGTGPFVIVFISVINSFFPIFILIREAVKSIPSNYLEVAAIFGASKPATLVHVVFPVIAVNIVNGIRTSFCQLWEILLAAEIVTGIRGFGSFVAGAGPATVALASVLLMIMVTVTIDRVLLRQIEAKLRARTVP